MVVSEYDFTPSARISRHGDYWLAIVRIDPILPDRWLGLSRTWTQPCNTRWGARRVAKRMAKKFRKACERGEFFG